MPKIDERIQALEAKLKQLKVLQQRKEARARTTGACRASISAVLVLFMMGLGAVQGANPPSPCPSADAWNEAHREQLPEAMAARDATRSVTDPDLRKELQERFAADQRARKDYLAAPRDPAVKRRMDQLDAGNLDWLKAMVREKGIPTAEQVGENGVKWAAVSNIFMGLFSLGMLGVLAGNCDGRTLRMRALGVHVGGNR